MTRAYAAVMTASPDSWLLRVQASDAQRKTANRAMLAEIGPVLHSSYVHFSGSRKH